MENLNLPYKGDRNYVNGTDVYHAMVRVFQDEHKGIPVTTKLSFRRLGINQLAFTQDRLAGKPVHSVFEVTTQESKVVYYLYETDSIITARIDYDEADIVKNGYVSDEYKKAGIRDYDRYSILEISVALLKEMCNKLISDSVKWTFVEICFNQNMPIHTRESLEVHLIKNLGTKMVVSHIFVKGEHVGILKFSSR